MTIQDLIEQLQEAARIIGKDAKIGTVRADRITGVEVRGSYAVVVFAVRDEDRVTGNQVRESLGLSY